MARTTADIPPVIAAEYRGASKPMAAAEADGDGYAKPPKVPESVKPATSQYSLPRTNKRKKLGL